MAVITSRTSLSQGSSLAVSGAIFATGTGADIRIHTGAANNLPALAANEFFEVRDHSSSQNNGLYRVVTVNTSTDDYECDKVNGLAPVTAGAEAITTLGATGASTEKSVFFDTAGLGIYLLEQGNLDVDGVQGKAFYSFAMQEWKDDDFLIANAPFPMLTIDSDAGKYIIGQDASGNSSGWNFVDDVAGFSIRTRKLMRNAGWDEVNSAGVTTARYVGVVTLGAFEDETPVTGDLAYYQFGDNTVVDDTTDFDFTGPVNEAVRFYNLIGDLSGDTPAFATTTTITRTTGSFVTDGFVVGGQITIINSTSNDGTYELSAVSATSMTITTTWTAEAWGTTEIIVNNDNAMTLRLRVRDGDPFGKTFAQANLASAGKDILGNFVYSFPLANSTDLKIAATDATITGNTPYTGMTITYYATPQSKSGLVGGSFNFGIVINGNNGTAQEVYEFVQYQLRQTSDIDNDGDTAIGRAMDGLMRFVGDALEVGSADGGLTFPTNPDGGGSGVFIDNLNASSKNDVSFYDNTGTSRAFPETIAVTLDFNATLENDTAAEYDLFYDRTIRTTVSDLVLTSGTSKITSAGSNLPNNSEIAVGKYVRLAGMTEPTMDGVYQITAITTPTSDWTVVRYDGAALITSSTASVTVDQNCIDTPDAILVHTDVTITATTIALNEANPDTITDSGNGFGIFAAGDVIEIEGSAADDGVYLVATAAVGTLTLDAAEDLVGEVAGSSITITKVVSGLADVDETFSYDFDGNTQGGRTVSTTTFVKAKAIGASTAQYTESTVQQIQTGTPLTIPLVSQQERNYA